VLLELRDADAAGARSGAGAERDDDLVVAETLTFMSSVSSPASRQKAASISSSAR
jgi:hypothetical protein